MIHLDTTTIKSDNNHSDAVDAERELYRCAISR